MTGPLAIKRLVEMVAGQSPRSVEVTTFDGEGLPFLQGNGEFGRTHPEAVYRCDTVNRICRPGDILVARRLALAWRRHPRSGRRVLAVSPPVPGLSVAVLMVSLLGRLSPG